MTAPQLAAAPERRTSLAGIFRIFLVLGLTSFGGPVAHLAYFRDEFVERRRWLDDAAYADLVALCQFLPGPASSQVGFALGILRSGGLGGGLAAWLGFTLPSALLMAALGATALGAHAVGSGPAAGVVHGLKLVAVAIVAQAVWGMARSLAPDLPRAGIALAALAATLIVDGGAGQLLAIGGGALAGVCLCRDTDPHATPGMQAAPAPVSRRTATAALALFSLLLAATPLLAAFTSHPLLLLFDAFYRAGAFVFGGGHVVLPLLQARTVETGWVAEDAFLAGYGAAQALPGPLFAFAAYLGAAGAVGGPVAGAAVALVAIFLPGLLLVAGTLPYWERLRSRPVARQALRGANAAVVGILGAALYDPVWTGAILGIRDVAVALAGFILLTVYRTRPWIVVGLSAAAGALMRL